MSAIVWFRRELRLHEHPALRAALDAHKYVPVFCVDDRLLHGRHASGPRISSFARQRGERARKVLDAAGLTLHGHPGLSAIDDVGATRTQAGKPYSVFSAFHRSWDREGRREVLGAPRQLPALPSGLARGEIPSLASLGLEQEVDEPPKGGEHEGRKRP